MLRVATMAELFDAAETLALTQQQIGDRLAILTNGGGAGRARDRCARSRRGGRLATLSPETIARLTGSCRATWSRGNPVDIIGDASGKRYAEALEALFADAAASTQSWCSTARPRWPSPMKRRGR